MRRMGRFSRWAGAAARCAAVGTLLSACWASVPEGPTPYQRFTQDEGRIPGGFFDRYLGDGVYIVTFRGNPSTLYEDTVVFAHRRARELCSGPFDTVSEENVSAAEQADDRATAVRVGYTTVVRHRHGRTTVYPRVSLRVHCRAPESSGD